MSDFKSTTPRYNKKSLLPLKQITEDDKEYKNNRPLFDQISSAAKKAQRYIKGKWMDDLFKEVVSTVYCIQLHCTGQYDTMSEINQKLLILGT